MNNSAPWSDAPAKVPTYVPSRLELAQRAPEWVVMLPEAVILGWVSLSLNIRADSLDETMTDGDRLWNYDLFIRDLLQAYSDQTIYEAQMEWIRGETAKIEAEQS
tara:strand:+ start:520 stop:834 length:315 start_codon:yes stop_codon:yes gene_type:complete